MRSMSRSACVILINAVTLAQMTTNAPKVVRNTYLPIDPIRLRVPDPRQSPLPDPSLMCPDADPGPPLIAEQNGLAKAKPLTMHNKTLIRERASGTLKKAGVRGRWWHHGSRPLPGATGPSEMDANLTSSWE